jgi:hypothetical protein
MEAERNKVAELHPNHLTLSRELVFRAKPLFIEPLLAQTEKYFIAIGVHTLS